MKREHKSGWLRGASIGAVGFGLGFFCHIQLQNSAPSRSGSTVAPPVGTKKCAPRPPHLPEQNAKSGAFGSAVDDPPPDRAENKSSDLVVLDRLVKLRPHLCREMQQASQQQWVANLFKDLSNSDPRRAAGLLQSVDDEAQWGVLADSLIRAWASRDSKAAYDWFLQQQDRFDAPTCDYFNTFILARLSEQNPEYASRLISSVVDPHLKEVMLRGMAQSWVSKDSRAAFRWLDSLLDDDTVPWSVVTSCYLASMTQYIELDPEAAAATILALDSESLQVKLIEPLVAELAQQDLIGSMVWVQQLESPDARKFGMEAIISAYADRAPDVVLEYVLNCSAPSEEGINLLNSAFVEVFDVAPARAVARLDQLPEYARARVVESIALNWLRQDESAAKQWIGMQASGAVYDAAAASASMHYLNEQPVAAVEWASRIEDPTGRMQQLRTVINSASGESLRGLQSAIEQAGATSDESNELKQLFAKRVRNEFPTFVLP